MFGRGLVGYRERLGLTQEALAEKAGLSARSVRALESGRRVPRKSSLTLLADALGLHGAEREEFCRRAYGSASGAKAGADRGRVATIPAQLPPDVPAFLGRTPQLARLDDLLGGTAELSRPVVISAVSGTAGVGKTALAVHWAHRVAHRFPDGQLYVNLHGYDPERPVAPAEVLARLLEALGVAGADIPSGMEERAARYRTEMARRRALILLDNARDAQQVRPLLPGGPSCFVVVTSRNQLTPLIAAGAHAFTLDLLSITEARQLLASRLGPDRVDSDPAAVEAIIAACARLPLALTIAAARAQQTGFSLNTVADELADSAGRLDTLDGGDHVSHIGTVFSWSYTALTAPAARMFRLLGLHPGADLTASAAASLNGRLFADTRPLLAELTRVHLLTENVPGRYTFHDLLRAYARAHLFHVTSPASCVDQLRAYAGELAARADADVGRRAALRRLLDHYVHSAHGAARQLDPMTEPVTPAPPVAGVTPERFSDREQALSWFNVERPVLTRVVDLAVDARYDRHAGDLADAVAGYLERCGHWAEWIATQETALAAAVRRDDPVRQAHAHRTLGRAHVSLNTLDAAGVHFRQALDLFDKLGDHIGYARTHHNLAGLYERRGRFADALRHAEQALALCRAAGHRVGQASALGAVGWFRAHLGDHRRAIGDVRRSLTLFRDLDHAHGQAAAWDSMGFILHRLARHSSAATSYVRAIDLYRRTEDRYEQARSLHTLGDVHQDAGDPVAARTAWQEALAIFDQLRHPQATEVRARLAASSAPDGVRQA
jgi:tetratricopeptide (TPR) repeat protein/transcriptional regulator with XRE-family HTH domain